MAGDCTRRELARLGLGGAVAAGALLGPRGALAQPAGDASVLEDLVRLEQRSVRAYTAAADGGRLGGLEPVARLFAEQDQEHADGLSRALRRLGDSPPRPSEERTALREGPRSFAELAVGLETGLVAAYQDALGTLASAELVSTAVSIVANHAQHLVVLRQALGLDPSPAPFVTGRRSVH
jgi:Ferritin-like domain